MTENNSLMALTDQQYNTATLLATDFSSSGLFPNVKNKSQAMVLILVGQEMGISALASVTGIHLIAGKPVIGANLMAERIKSSGNYNYKIVEHTDKICKIDFYQGKDKIGTSEFTIEDANKAGVTNNPNWKKYPKNMLFARALSNGQRWHCPDVFGGKLVYTPDEMGAAVNEEGELDSRVINVAPNSSESYNTISVENIEKIKTALDAMPNSEKSLAWIIGEISALTKNNYSSLDQIPEKYTNSIFKLIQKLEVIADERQKKMSELHVNLESFSKLHQLDHDSDIVRDWIRTRAGVDSMTEMTKDQIQSQIIYIKKSVATQDIDEDFFTFYAEKTNAKENETISVETTTPEPESSELIEDSIPPTNPNL